MPLDYLARLERARFPLLVRKASDVDKVRVLKAAEYITASVPLGPLNTAFGEEGEAVIFGLTERGESALRGAMAPPEAPLQRGRRDSLDD
ncbi:hypothetical protein [Pseudorhodoferax sp. Leaf265]|jgi:hypothetical protein|uniref:hypothetical protein n=1 Tax=Pseudorhodoferax sp. Leaf265 TaxID=1736315 RepID=UPI000700A335|nr:hypothetical protein [Pseudorhodoferax sp. Leaf265]KQP19365.1 hypothetical protein ASF45_25130 [Pseudorhodoferax sp. Leaf265]PZP99544.1 MAG: hypothetical protein DI583_10735 [Variovorax paradoxus]PZQ11458.1 MAG: hypothetical protein DI587_10735 [Variovorax paradoxus]